MHSLWGVRTARWLSRSRAGAMQYQETRLHPLMVEALALIYKAQLAVARTVHSGLDGSDAAAIQAATTLKGQVLDEILNGQLKDQLLVDLRLSPLGEAVFDNFNEVVEGRARELLGLRAHEGRQGCDGRGAAGRRHGREGREGRREGRQGGPEGRREGHEAGREGPEAREGTEGQEEEQEGLSAADPGP